MKTNDTSFDQQNDDGTNKGGRNPKLNAEYFGVPATPGDQQMELMRKYKHEGTAFYLAIFQKLCGEEYFLWHFDKGFKLNAFAATFQFDKKKFKAILNYAVTELELFDKELYDRGYIFSETFLKNFSQSGLFRKRKYNEEYIKEYITGLKKNKPKLTRADGSAVNEKKAELIKPNRTEQEESKGEESNVKQSKGNQVQGELTELKGDLTGGNPKAQRTLTQAEIDWVNSDENEGL